MVGFKIDIGTTESLMFKNNLEAKTTIVLEHVAEIINN